MPKDFSQRDRDVADGSCQELCSSETLHPVPDYIYVTRVAMISMALFTHTNPP